MSASGPVVIALIAAEATIRLTRAALSYRTAQRTADRKAAKETTP